MCSWTYLHVLPRHRLFPQPHGFEGLVLTQDRFEPYDPVATEGPELKETQFDGDSAALPCPTWRPSTNTLSPTGRMDFASMVKDSQASKNRVMYVVMPSRPTKTPPVDTLSGFGRLARLA